MTCDTCRQPSPYDLALEAIHLFREYRDLHGLDEEQAADKAAAELADGYQTTEQEMQPCPPSP